MSGDVLRPVDVAEKLHSSVGILLPIFNGSINEGLKELRHGLCALKVQSKYLKFVVCNPCESSPSLTIFVPLWFIIFSLVFFCLS